MKPIVEHQALGHQHPLGLHRVTLPKPVATHSVIKIIGHLGAKVSHCKIKSHLYGPTNYQHHYVLICFQDEYAQWAM